MQYRLSKSCGAHLGWPSQALEGTGVRRLCPLEGGSAWFSSRTQQESILHVLAMAVAAVLPAQQVFSSPFW